MLTLNGRVRTRHLIANADNDPTASHQLHSHILIQAGKGHVGLLDFRALQQRPNCRGGKGSRITALRIV
eukprot:1683574-Rhodomonas_salina.2